MSRERFTERRVFGPTLGWYDLPIVGQETRRQCGLGFLAKAIAVAAVAAGVAIVTMMVHW